MTALESRHSVMVLYCDDHTLSGHVVRLVVAEKDIAAEIEFIDPDDKPDELLRINPYGSLPTLIDRDLVLYGTRVIVDYLDERYPHPPFMPIDPVSRAKTRLALHRIEKDWYSLFIRLEDGESDENESRRLLTHALVGSSDVFAAMPYFLSEEYSVIDATLAPLLWRLKRFSVELPEKALPIRDYADRIFSRPGFQNSLTEKERDMA